MIAWHLSPVALSVATIGAPVTFRVTFDASVRDRVVPYLPDRRKPQWGHWEWRTWGQRTISAGVEWGWVGP